MIRRFLIFALDGLYSVGVVTVVRLAHDFLSMAMLDVILRYQEFHYSFDTNGLIQRHVTRVGKMDFRVQYLTMVFHVEGTRPTIWHLPQMPNMGMNSILLSR